jgi:competence protein ComEC
MSIDPSGQPARFGQRSQARRHPRGFTLVVLAMLLISATLLTVVLVQREFSAQSGSRELGGERLPTIAVLDVGQAIAAAVVTEDGAALVYDFGLTRSDAEDVILPFLREHRVDQIDYAVLSHPHQDHVGGLPTILEEISIGLYIDPVLETTNQTYLQSLEMIEEREISVVTARRGDEYLLGENAVIEILWPVEDLLINRDGSHRLNDNSTVVRLTIGDVTVLFTGDIEADAEAALGGDYGRELAVDILQIAHHGSNTSSQDEFLELASPEVGIIPVGPDNQYGHPHAEVMQRLRSHGIEIYRTDVDGTVIIETDGVDFDITTTRTDQSKWRAIALLRRWTKSRPMLMGSGSRYLYSMMASN